MTFETLIAAATSSLKPTDSVAFALGLMMELRVRHLPVVSADGILLGLISEEQLLDAAGPEAAVETILGSRVISVLPDSHVFDGTQVMMKYDLTTVPVAREDGSYVGLVRRHDVFGWFARMLSTHESGAILALEIDPRDYALSKLLYTVEQNDVKVLSVATERMEHKVGVTLKLNVKDASRVRHMLEHHGYNVVAAFGEDEGDEELMDRIQAFMRYLEV